MINDSPDYLANFSLGEALNKPIWERIMGFPVVATVSLTLSVLISLKRNRRL